MRRVRPFYANTHTRGVVDRAHRHQPAREGARGRARLGRCGTRGHRALHRPPGRRRRSTSSSGCSASTCPSRSRVATASVPASPSTSARWCSSGRTSITPTSCRGSSSVADVIEIGLNDSGHVDRKQLEEELARYAERPPEDRVVLRGEQRHRDPHRRRVAGPYAARGGGLRLLRLRRGRALRAHRHASLRSGCVHRRAVPVDPQVPWGGLRRRGCWWANRNLFRGRVPAHPGGGTVDYVAGRITRCDRLHRAPCTSARRPVRRRSSRICGRGRPSWSRRWWGRSASATTRSRWPVARWSGCPSILASRSSGPRRRTGCRSSRSTSNGCTTISCPPCSIICSGSRIGPAAPARRGPMGIACSGSIAPPRSASGDSIGDGVDGMKPGWVRNLDPLLRQRGRLEFLLAAGGVRRRPRPGVRAALRAQLARRRVAAPRPADPGPRATRAHGRRAGGKRPRASPPAITKHRMDRAASPRGAGALLADARELARALEARWGGRAPAVVHADRPIPEVDALRVVRLRARPGSRRPPAPRSAALGAPRRGPR